MIDEFQDTSIIQWNNFNPLIVNSMAEGNDNLVVGDVKQSRSTGGETATGPFWDGFFQD